MPNVSMYKCGRQNYHPYKLYTPTVEHALVTGSRECPKKDIILNNNEY